MKKIKALTTLVIVGLVAIFAVQNAATVDLRFLFWSFSMPRALLVMALLCVGFFLGVIVYSLASLKSERPRKPFTD